MIKEINNINKFEDHFPVMLNEVMDALDPKDNEIYVDATFGAGGYSSAILEKANCRLFAIDRDPSVKKFASKIEGLFPNRFTLMMGRFSEIKELLIEQKISEIDGLVLDIGVSSMQIDEEKRGFSFDSDKPLDMRMNQAGDVTARTICHEYSDRELTKIFREFGELSNAYKQILILIRS
jgi:16S rRNA (cytosine1402-N4)-methyltransferase